MGTSKKFFVSDDAYPMSEEATFGDLEEALAYRAARPDEQLNVGELTGGAIAWHSLRTDLPAESYRTANWAPGKGA